MPVSIGRFVHLLIDEYQEHWDTMIKLGYDWEQLEDQMKEDIEDVLDKVKELPRNEFNEVVN